MKFFDLPDNFVSQWKPLNEKYDVLASDYMRENGFPSCKYVSVPSNDYSENDEFSYWEMDGVEYTLFLLRWV